MSIAAPSEPVVGASFRLRRAQESDRPGLVQMLERCSDETRLRRFHGNTGSFPEPYFTQAVEGGPRHYALVAEKPGADVGLASCCMVADGAAELALLVEDAHQRQGIGTCMVAMLVEHAQRTGLCPLTASVLVEQAWILRVLRRFGPCQTVVSLGVIEVTLRPG
jgi:GNAT superfamily N-acetyltransferase